MAQSFVSFFWQFIRVVVLQRGHKWGENALAALREWVTPESNPFLLRALRVESRKLKPFWTIAATSFILLLTLLLTWWLWNKISALSGDFVNRRMYRWALDVFSENPINWLAITTCSASAYIIIWCARARSAYLLRQEVLKNTLVQLQQLPFAEERWIWLMASHPALLGVLIGACGLPIYALAIFTNQWRVLDVIGLFILFFLLGHVPPSWQLTQWQQSNDKQSKTNWQAWRESLKIQQDAGASESQKLEAGRRAQRALAGQVEEYSASEAQKKTSFFELLNSSKRKQNNGWNIFGFIWAFSVFNGIFASALGTANPLTASWPPEVTSLISALPVTWPLFTARLIFAPVDFFALQLPPFLLLLPLWIALNHQMFVSLAAQVSTAETFWTPKRASRKSKMQILITAISVICIFGYGWPLWVDSSLLARILAGAPVTPDFAETALLTLLGVLGALGAGLHLEAPFKRARHASLEISPQAAFHQSARIALGISLSAFGLYFLFCWLGARNGLSTPTLARMPLVLFTIIAFLVVDFGSAAFGSTLSGDKLRLWRLLRSLWFQGLALLCVVLIIRGWALNNDFIFSDASVVLLSPFVTLLALFRFKVPISPAADPLFWNALFAQFAIGSLCLLLAARTLFFAHGSTPALGNIRENADAPTRFLSWLEPLWKVGRAISAVWTRIVSAFVSVIESFNALNFKIVRWGEKWGNAVLTYELRRRVRKENWMAAWLSPLIGGTCLFVTVARPWELRTIGTPGFGSANFYQEWGTLVSSTSLIAMWALGALATLNIGRSFDADRANGTLIFLFLTPQTDAQILVGKVLTQLIFVAGWIWSGLIWLLLGVLTGFVFSEGKTLLFFALSGLCALAACLLFYAAVNLFFAIPARKPAEGQSWAFLFIGIFESLTVIGFLLLNGITNDSLSASDSTVSEELVACALLIVFALLHLALAFAAWKLALRSFAKRRYGDVEASGKGAS